MELQSGPNRRVVLFGKVDWEVGHHSEHILLQLNDLAKSVWRRSFEKLAFCTTTRVPRRVALRTHCGVQCRCVVSEERVGGRAGTAAPQGAVCELPNPPDFFCFPLHYRTKHVEGGPAPGPPFRLHPSVYALHPKAAAGMDISRNRSE
jgi:hypothetical protein